MNQIFADYRLVVFENYANFACRDNQPDFWRCSLDNFLMSILISIVTPARNLPKLRYLLPWD